MHRLGHRAAIRRRLPFVLAAVLATTQAALLVSTARDKSDTVDEDTYLPAAAVLWAHRDFGLNAESPVLPKWAFALALAAVEPALGDTPRERAAAENFVLWYGDRARLERILLAARLTTIAVTVLAGLLLWRVGRRFGTGSGLVAHALWCFSPTVLAAGSLAILDAWVTAMVVGLTWATARLVERPSWGRVLVAGLFAGLTLGCKITGLGAVMLAGLVTLWAVRRRELDPGRPWATRAGGYAVLGGLAAVLTLWALYGFSVGRVRWQGTEGLAAAVGAALPTVPFPAWIEGVLMQVSHGTRGHRNYLFGETSLTGWRWFYLANLALKTTIGAQALALMLVAAWLARRPRGRELLIDVALLSYPVLLVATMSAGRTQLGIRYILPAFPGAMLWAGRTFPALASLRPPWTAGAGVAAILAGMLGALRMHPHYLMFANSWVGGPEHGPEYVVTGDCLGQDQKRLADWQAGLGLRWIYYTWYSGRPDRWGVVYVDPPCRPRVGVYALEAIEVHRPRRIEAGCLDWLVVEPPDDRIGYSVYVYWVPKERMLRLRQRPPSSPPFWK